MERLVQFLSGHGRAVFTNGRPRARLGGRARVGLIALRSALFLLILFLLLKPVVVVPSVIPRSSTVALLADDSRSMQMADAGNGRTRLDAMRAALFDTEGTFQ